jgi:hypothetical protein
MEQLFGSKTRVKLLKLFLMNPNRSFYVREITRKIEEQINSVRRELANLLSLGIITSDSTNNKLFYEVNQSYEHYDALRALFAPQAKSTGSKTTKKQQTKEVISDETPVVLDDIWARVGHVDGLLYSGVFTRDTQSPIDVLVVGDVSQPRVESAVAQLEQQEGKGELRYAIMDTDEWRYRRQIHDKFWSEITSAKNQVLVDNASLFTKH